MTFSEWLTANEYDEPKLSEKQRKHLENAWKAETAPTAKVVPQPPTHSPGDNDFSKHMAFLEEKNSRIAYFRERGMAAAAQNVGNHEKVKQIRQLAETACAEVHAAESPETLKTDKRDFDLALMRLDRSLPTNFSTTPRDHTVTSDVLEAALCMGQKLPTLEKRFDSRVLDMASREFGQAFSLMDFVSYSAQRNGYRGSFSKGNLRGVLRSAFQQSGGEGPMAVGPSTIDVPGILSNIGNKFIRDAFEFVDADWRQIAFVKPVNDFKTITTFSLTGDMTYEELPPGGEIKHGNLGEETYSNRAKAYAKLLGIDYQDWVNDDLGAFTRVARLLGRGGALKLNDVVWGAFLNNSAFFTAGRGNYDDGAGDTLMDLTGLANANTLFELMTDPDGKPSGIKPAIVLVPPQLWPAAFTLLNSTQLNLATSTAAATGTQSPWAGMFKLVKSRYLAMSSMTGNSAKAWYMVADPADVPVLEVCFLFGAEMPTVESGTLEFDRLGIAMRGYHSFGAALQEYRAGVKMKGEN